MKFLESYLHRDVDVLKGEVLKSIKGLAKDEEEVIFETVSGRIFKMFHKQDCCESVSIEDVIGDVSDIISSPLLMCEEVSNKGEEDEYGGTSTWTFYKLATIKGYVTIRWYGESNGYYSEEVSFAEVFYYKTID